MIRTLPWLACRGLFAACIAGASAEIGRAQEQTPVPSGSAPAAPAAPVELDPARPATAPAIEGGLPAARGAGPVELPEKVRVEMLRKLARTAEQLRPNVVQLSIERAVGDGVIVSLQASGLVLDEAGHVLTIGSTLQQAGRVAVHFAGSAQMRPRRARLLGVDEKTDVGVLAIGPVRLPTLALAEMTPGAAADSTQRYVVTLTGAPDEQEFVVSAGWMHDPVPNFTFGQRQFDRLLRVRISRCSQCAGGVLAEQGGKVVGLMLAPAQMTGGAVPTDGMLALPAETVKRGMQSVLASASVGPAIAPAVRARPWLGFGATELEEPEFLRQLGVARAVVVSEIFEESPALAAGIAPHDVILRWNGEPVGGVDALYARLAASEPGRAVVLDCVRGLERRKVDVTLGAW